MKNYQLEIYQPGSVEDVAAYVESDKPFLTVSKGDLLNPVDSAAEANSDGILRVVGMEHILWKSGADVRHKLCVFTENVENTARVRLS